MAPRECGAESHDVQMGSRLPPVPSAHGVIGARCGRRSAGNRQDRRRPTGRPRDESAFLRIDTVEDAISRSEGRCELISGDEGTCVGYGLAADQLALGLDVVVECVNPIAVTRDAWLAVATEPGRSWKSNSPAPIGTSIAVVS